MNISKKTNEIIFWIIITVVTITTIYCGVISSERNTIQEVKLNG